MMYGSMVEWLVHKIAFHRWGKNKNSMFAFHLRDHHVKSIKDNFYDPKVSALEWAGTLFLIGVHIPLYFLNPWFYLGASIYAVLFAVVHNYSHKYPEWAKKWVPWHYDHHMKYQNDNMNVVLPIFDYVMGTRKKYLDKNI